MSLKSSEDPFAIDRTWPDAMGTYVYIGVLEGDGTPIYWKQNTEVTGNRWDHLLSWRGNQWLVSVMIILKI